MERVGDAIPLALGGVATTSDDLPAVHATARRICEDAGMPRPTVWLVPCAEPNAFASGLTPYDAAISLTTGLLERVDTREARAVVAHELGHIVHRDVAEATSLAHRQAATMGVTFGATVAAQALAFFTAGLLDDLLVAGAGRAINAAVRRNAERKLREFSHRREMEADKFAVEHGYGGWLGTALARIEAFELPAEARLPRWSRILLAADPTPDSTHPPTLVRLAAIPPVGSEELEAYWCAECDTRLPPGEVVCPSCGVHWLQVACSCGCPLRGFERYCPACGLLIASQLCRVCLAAVPEGAPYCGRCGFPRP